METIDSMLLRKSVELRGSILHLTIHIERKLDDFLADYFCKHMLIANELKEVLFATERITLGSKKDILFILLNRHFKQFIKDNPKFINTLEHLIPHRNVLAHLEMDLSSVDKHEAFVFNKYKNGKLTPVKYSAQDIENLRNDTTYLSEKLDELIKTSEAP